jgi:hypothetical protein
VNVGCKIYHFYIIATDISSVNLSSQRSRSAFRTRKFSTCFCITGRTWKLDTIYLIHEDLRLSFPENVKIPSFPVFICKNNEKLLFPAFVFMNENIWAVKWSFFFRFFRRKCHSSSSRVHKYLLRSSKWLPVFCVTKGKHVRLCYSAVSLTHNLYYLK